MPQLAQYRNGRPKGPLEKNFVRLCRARTALGRPFPVGPSVLASSFACVGHIPKGRALAGWVSLELSWPPWGLLRALTGLGSQNRPCARRFERDKVHTRGKTDCIPCSLYFCRDRGRFSQFLFWCVALSQNVSRVPVATKVREQHVQSVYQRVNLRLCPSQMQQSDSH